MHHSVGKDPDCCVIVKLYGIWTLFVSGFIKGCLDGDGFASVNEGGASLRFLSRGHDGVDDFVEDKDWCVVGRCRL